MRAILLSCAALLAATPALAQKAGEPPITDLTKVSGGPLDPERAALSLEHVDLAVEVFPDTHKLAGVATLTLATSAPQKRLLIDLDRNLAVSAISIDGRPLKPAAWTNPEGRLIITLPRPLGAGGKVTAKIAYGGTPHVAVRAPWDDGMVWAKTPDGRPWIASTSEGYGCDLQWPCLDFPRGEPGSVDLHVTVPKGLKVAAGGKLVKVDTLADGRSTWNWRANSPNPYSVVLQIAPYEVLEAPYHSRYGNVIDTQYWYLPGEEEQAKGLFAEFAPTLDFYEALVGPYPWGSEKVGVAETPHLGMEHQTINAYGNHYRKDATGFDWLFQHEFGHEWFGNQMTAANWDDYWLHEGYEEYMQPLYGRWREGEARYAVMMEDLRNQIQNKAPIVAGRVMTEEQVYEEANGGPGNDIYMKGAWVLHTLRNTIGDKAFWEVTRRIVYGRPDPKPGNFKPRFASTDEYQQIVKQVTGKDYDWFFAVYLRQAALPELVQTREGDRLILTWKAPNGLPFRLPVEVQIDDQVRKLAMSGGSDTITVPADAHVVVDPASRLLKRSEAVEAFQRQGGRRR